jgi:hypothetical protein
MGVGARENGRTNDEGERPMNANLFPVPAADSKLEGDVSEACVFWKPSTDEIAVVVTGSRGNPMDVRVGHFGTDDSGQAAAAAFLGSVGFGVTEDAAEILIGHAIGRQSEASYFPADDLYRLGRTGKYAETEGSA